MRGLYGDTYAVFFFLIFLYKGTIFDLIIALCA